MILDVCFEIYKLEDSILNFQILFDMGNMELKMSQHIRRTFLWSVACTTSERYCIDLALNKHVSVHAKWYSTEIMCPGCLSFIYLGLHTNCISVLTS